MSGELKFILLFLFVGMITLLIVLGTSDKLWDNVDHAMTPYVQYDEGEHRNATGSASVAAGTIKVIHIAWVNGNVDIVYAPQDRITWVETYTSGEPTRDNEHTYWMNTTMISIDYCNIDKNALSDNARQKLSKDLLMRIPEGCELDEIVVRNATGRVNCEVKAKKVDIKTRK